MPVSRIGCATGRVVDPFVGRRVAFELAGWAAGTLYQVTAAVGADQLKLVGCAGGAEGAFEGTNTRLGGVGRKVFVTTFARRPKFEHDDVLNEKSR